MGDPSMYGSPAGSDAQTGEKTFPPGTDPASIQLVSGMPGAPVEVGTPLVAQMREARPVGDRGMGYREVAPEGNVH